MLAIRIKRDPLPVVAIDLFTDLAGWWVLVLGAAELSDFLASDVLRSQNAAHAVLRIGALDPELGLLDREGRTSNRAIVFFATPVNLTFERFESPFSNVRITADSQGLGGFLLMVLSQLTLAGNRN